jgi:hypothetical protein
MNELFLFIGDYLKGKSIMPSIRRTLNFLFNISISSYLFERIYGSYTWLNYNDYKGILDFFIKGNFFIPFSIFLVVYGITQFLSMILFLSINYFKAVKLTKEILEYQFKKELIDKLINEINEVSEIVSPIQLTKATLVSLYQNLRTHLTPEAFENMESSLKEPKQDLETTFYLAFRMMIAITIYFISIPQFGWFLYSIATVFIIVGMYVIMIAYRFLDVFPTLTRKFHHQAEEYLQIHLKQKLSRSQE